MSTLTLINLRKQFGNAANVVTAVNDVSLNVSDGEFLCILGPSGCGKSTALRMVGGFEEPTSGDVQIDDTSVVHLPPNKRPTAMVFQKYTLWPHMRVFDNIAFGLRLRNLNRTEVAHEVKQALDLVGLGSYAQRYPAQLSGGEQQRVALARALVLRPKILLLDEPFSSLDALLRVRLREELRAIQRRIQITAIFVTHDQEEALTLADRIAVMNKGNLEQLDKPSHIYAQPRSLFVADFIGAMNLLAVRVEGNAIRVGERVLPAPQGFANGQATLAIRPEDFSLGEGDGHWLTQIHQLSDLGHYRKALANADGVGPLKLYLPKSAQVHEGKLVKVRPMRYLVYQGSHAPVEVHG
jgi:putative spermidine/putrescine transport system ATP-binding protein